MRRNRRSLKESFNTEVKFLVPSDGLCEIYEDSYTEGEGKYVSTDYLMIDDTYDTIQDIIEESLHELAFDNLADEAYDIQNWGYFDANGGELVTDIFLLYDDMEGVYYVPDERSEELEMWKNNEIKGYVARISIPLRVTMSPRALTYEEAETLGLQTL